MGTNKSEGVNRSGLCWLEKKIVFKRRVDDMDKKSKVRQSRLGVERIRWYNDHR